MQPTAFLDAPRFPGPITGSTPREVITTLVDFLAAEEGWSPDTAALALDHVLAREALTPTGLGAGLAVPHGFVPGLAAPACAIGTVAEGVDFSAPDATEAHVIVLIVHPDEPEARARHLGVLAELARRFHSPALIDRLLAASDPQEAREAFISEA